MLTETRIRQDRLVALVRAFVADVGGPDPVDELAAAINAVADPQDYLRRVAAGDVAGARNLLTAAVIGLALSGGVERTRELARG